MNWELILRIGAVVVAALAAIPGIYAIRKQLLMESVEKEKALIDIESVSAEVAAKLIDSAGDLQTLYEKLFNEVRKQLEEQKEIVCRLEIKIDTLTEENRELKIIVDKQNKKIEELEEGICTLVEQVKELGQEPKYPKGA